MGLDGQLLVPTPIEPLNRLPIAGFTITDDYVCVVLSSKRSFVVKNHRQFADIIIVIPE